MSIATDMEQGAVLKNAGVDPATADMHYIWVWDSAVENKKKWILQVGMSRSKDDKPAWSLDKLVELLCCDRRVDVYFNHVGNEWICYWIRKREGIQTVLSRAERTKVAAAFLVLRDLIKSREIEIGGK